MRASTQMGQNRTGVQFAPELSRDMEESVSHTPTTRSIDPHALCSVRALYYESAEPMGSKPAGAPAAGESASQMVGHGLEFFMDKLGERIAFERSGTRLYETVLSKVEAEGSWAGGPSVEHLERIRNEELQHFNIARDALITMGGDPTAVTPSADAIGVASEGLMKLITDPRSSVAESLEALLVVELTDNDSWQRLIQLAESVGQKDLVKGFQKALQEEEEHLQSVRGWLQQYSEQQVR